MRIGLFGQFGSGNSGNDGSLESMLLFVRQVWPEAELLCICARPDVIEGTFHVAATGISAAASENRGFNFVNARLLNLPRRVRNLAWSSARTRGLDVLIVPGTGILDDFHERPFGWPFMILRWCLAAWLNRVPILFVSIGAGPIRHPLSRTFMKTAARLASYRSYRDRLSRDYMKGIGFDVARDPVNCDLAFKLPVPEARERAGATEITVGVGVMSYSGWQKARKDGENIYRAYLGKMADFVTWLLDRGMKVRLLTGDAADREAVGRLLDMAGHGTATGSAGNLVAPRIDTLHDLMREIGQTDVVVATRYHNVVCALKMGRPTISLGYAEKNDELLERVGLGNYCHHVETFDTETLKRQFSTLLEQRGVLEEKVRRGVREFGAELDKQDNVLVDKLGPASRRPAGRRPWRQLQTGRTRAGLS